MTPKVKFDMTRITNDKTVLVEYVDDPWNGQRAGVLVAKKMDSGIPRIGWAFAHQEMGDAFDRDFGLTVAFKRIECNRAVLYHPRYEDSVQRFCQRTVRYFHTPPEFPGEPLPSDIKV